jgi:alcohol dehydrogenase class IV
MQQILAASGSLAELAPVVARHARGPRIVIVSGPQSFDAIGGPALLRGLPGPWRLVTAAGVLPRLEDYDTLHAEIGRDGVDGLVAIGGGRVLDMAKLLSTGLPDAAEISRRLDAGEAIARGLPLVAVPTTAGSGSEATPFAVAYANGRKSSVDHPSLLPDAAIIDPSVLAGLPRAVVATAGLDALCHCIESLLSRRATPASRALARRGLRLGLANLEAAVAGRRAALARMSLTAHLAGRAIALTRTTIPHALSYPLTSRYGLAHGLAVSLSMATYLRLFGQRLATEPRLGDWAEAYGFVLASLGCASENTVAPAWTRLVGGLGLPATLAECGLGPDARHEAAGAVDTARLNNAPLALGTDDLAALFA